MAEVLNLSQTLEGLRPDFEFRQMGAPKYRMKNLQHKDNMRCQFEIIF